MARHTAGACAWTLHDMAQLRGLMKARAPLRVAALRLGRTELAVRVKVIEMSGRGRDAPDMSICLPSPGTSSRPGI